MKTLQLKATLVCAFPILFSIHCTKRAYTPPARSISMETAEPVQAGRSAVQVTGGYTKEVKHASLRGKYGIYPNAELSLEFNGANVSNNDRNSGAIFSGRTQLKQAFAGFKIFAFTVGLGGGHSAVAGNYASFDSGFVASFDNCILVPFATLNGYVSRPFTPQESAPGNNDAPSTTWGIQSSFGVRYEMLRPTCQEPGKLSLLAGFGSTSLISNGGLAPNLSDDSRVSFNQFLISLEFNL